MSQLQAGVSIIGVKGWGEILAHKMQGAECAKLIGVLDVDQDYTEQLAEKLSCRAYAELDQVLADTETKGIIIATPNHMHLDLVKRCVLAGKHILVEKPMANTCKEAAEMIHLCKQAGVVLGIGHQSRRMPGHRKLKQLVSEGVLGRVVQVEANFSHAGGWNLTPEHWRYHAEKCPLGPFNLLGVHHLDTLQYLLDQKIKSVAGGLAINTVGPSTADDCVMALLEFDGGALGYVGDAYVIPSTYYVFLHGTQAVARCWDGKDLTLCTTSGVPESIPIEQTDPEIDQLNNFADAIQGKAEYEVSGVHGYDVVAVLEAVQQSVHGEGRRVAVQHWSE